MKGRPITLYNERNNPCKGCQVRKLYCHGQCELYKKFDAENKSRRVNQMEIKEFERKFMR